MPRPPRETFNDDYIQSEPVTQSVFVRPPDTTSKSKGQAQQCHASSVFYVFPVFIPLQCWFVEDQLTIHRYRVGTQETIFCNQEECLPSRVVPGDQNSLLAVVLGRERSTGGHRITGVDNQSPCPCVLFFTLTSAAQGTSSSVNT